VCLSIIRVDDFTCDGITTCSANSSALPFGGLWYDRAEDAIGYAKFYSRSHHAVIRVFDEAGNIVATEEHVGNFREPVG